MIAGVSSGTAVAVALAEAVGAGVSCCGWLLDGGGVGVGFAVGLGVGEPVGVGSGVV